MQGSCLEILDGVILRPLFTSEDGEGAAQL